MGKLSGLSVRLEQAGPIPLDVSLEVAPGEIVGLVGPSGSGKTTTLRAIAGLYRPAHGLVASDGETWFDTARGIAVPARRRRIGMVFQSYALFPHLTALQNVMEALGKSPSAAGRDEARRLLARVHLEGLEGRRPAELSGGQQQRVAVARALARRPQVLLLDEPFSAVDRMTRHRLQRELAELRRGLNMPVLLVTHDLEEAARLADRIAVMHRGRTLQVGPIREVLTRPADATVARLVGIRNVFRGILADRPGANGAAVLEWGGYRLETAIPAPSTGGKAVAWCVPADSVIVHRTDRPSRGEHENPLCGRVVEALQLGEMTELTVAVGAAEEHPLHCSIPTHVARRNGIGAGAAIGLSLRAEAIHVMAGQGEELGRG